MGIGIRISDGAGTDRSARVTTHHAVEVAKIIPDVLPPGTLNRFRYISGRLGTTGLDSGTLNMNVDGSVTSVDFFIQADQDFDIFIMHINILLSGMGGEVKNFGGAAALGVGWDLFIEEEGISTFIIEKAKTGGSIVSQTGLQQLFGSGKDVQELGDFLATGTTAISAIVPMHQYIPGGFRLGRGSENKIIARVNDDLTVALKPELLEVRVFGYRHFPRPPENA